jgi:hypothetical protein
VDKQLTIWDLEGWVISSSPFAIAGLAGGDSNPRWFKRFGGTVGRSSIGMPAQVAGSDSDRTADTDDYCRRHHDQPRYGTASWSRVSYSISPSLSIMRSSTALQLLVRASDNFECQ